MKFLKKYGLLAILLGAVTVQAQTAPPAPKTLAPADMQLRVESIKNDIDEDHRHVLHLQALARKEKDVIKLTCINDKLVQLKAQMNLFDNASMQLDGATEGREALLAEAEAAGAGVKKLRGEADGCAGELEMYRQESRTDVDRPELDDPTSGDPFHFPEAMGDPTIDVPGFATPYK